MSETEKKAPDRVLLMPGHPVSAAYWRALSEHYALCFLYPQAQEHAASLGISCGHLGQFFDADAQEFAANEAARMVGTLHDRAWNFKAFCGDLPHDLDGRLNEWWPGYILSHAQSLTQRVSAMEALAGKVKIAGIVVHEDVAPDTRSMVLWARARGIPSVHVPHANCHLRDDAGPDIHRETRTDWIAASGQYMVEWYARHDFSRERIRVVGAPQMDALYQQRMERSAALHIWNFDQNDRIAVYATTWAQTTGLRGGWKDEHAAGLEAVLRLAKAQDMRLIIKIHPNDAGGVEKNLEDAMKAAGVKGRVARQHNHLALSVADLFIAQGPSNMCIEAAIFGVPACYLTTEGFDYQTSPLPFRGAPEALEGAAQMALESRGDPLWQDFIRFYNDAHPEANAVERLTEFVRGVCP